MSEALRLARFLDVNAMSKEDYEAAAELRRLSAVEQELEALKRAISDAEPVHFRALLDADQAPQQLKTSMHVVGFRDRKAAEHFVIEQSDFYGWRYTIEPLYTLKGIK